MEQYRIFDNLLPDTLVDDIYNELSSHEFPWHYNPISVSEHDITVAPEKDKDYPEQFTHGIVWENELVDHELFMLIRPILLFFEKDTGIIPHDIVRIKANLLVNKGTASSYNIPHTDHVDSNVKTLLYYVNDSDGDTVLFNQKWGDELDFTEMAVISPKAGRFVYFDSTQWHASSNPVNTKARYIININFR